MAKMFSRSLTLAAVMCAGLMGPVLAQDRGPPPMTTNQIADQIDARIARLKVDLRLTESQEKLWAAFASGLRDVSLSRAQRIAKARDEERNWRLAERDYERSLYRRDDRYYDAPPAQAPANPADPKPDASASSAAPTPPVLPDDLAMMRREAETMAQQADELRIIADASGPLYAALDSQQKPRLMRYLSEDNRQARRGR